MLTFPTFAMMPSLSPPAPKALWGVHYDQVTEEEKIWSCRNFCRDMKVQLKIE